MDSKITFKVDVRPSKSRGFSLLELIIVIGILTLVSTVTIVKHTGFNSSIVLSSLAYDIALSIRQAQVFGLAVRGYEDEASGDITFDTGYGVHFDRSTPKSYILFADRDRDFNYNALIDGDVDVFTIGRGNFIGEFCVENSSGVLLCASDPINPITYLDIIFDRPEPEAIIKTNIPGTYIKAICSESET